MTHPCFASEAGGSRSAGNCFPTGQNQTCEDALYYLQDCESNSTCEIGQVWGHPIGSWCVGSVVNMGNLFNGLELGIGLINILPNNINPDLSRWDTSSAETMGYMFSGQTLFNGNLSLWEVSQVKETNNMFQGASSFNGNLSLWNTSSVTKMGVMFYGAEIFNGDLSQWDTSSVTNMYTMFYGAESYNGDLSQWDTSSVTTMYGMFRDASSFNSSGSISNWNVTNVVNMVRMFEGATDFAQNLCPWKVAQAVSVANCYYYGFDQPCTSVMFTGSSGQPNDGSGGFNATACI